MTPMVGANNTRVRKWRIVLSILVLASVALFLVSRLDRQNIRKYTSHLAAFAWGDTVGCSLSDVLADMNGDPGRARRLRDSLAKLDVADGLVHWTSMLGDYWAPLGHDIYFVLLELDSDPYEDGSVRGQPGDVVLDCGANIGVFSRRALEAGAAHVIAIEPSPLNLLALEKNFASEIAAGRVTIVPNALWDESGTMPLRLYDNTLLDSLVMEDRYWGNQISEIDVELITIDELVEELTLDRVDFIKMDIEGAERNALRGAAETIKRFRPKLAIATENLLDDIYSVPAEVYAAVPDYIETSGACRLVRPGVIRPETLYFNPANPPARNPVSIREPKLAEPTGLPLPG